MEITALTYRESCLDILKFYSDSTQQLDFASRVYYDDYEAEFACWWFDDLAFEQLPNPTGLIKQSFSVAEIAVLQKFTEKFDGLDQKLGDVDRTMNELLKNSDWLQLTQAASEAVDEIEALAT